MFIDRDNHNHVVDSELLCEYATDVYNIRIETTEANLGHIELHKLLNLTSMRGYVGR